MREAGRGRKAPVQSHLEGTEKVVVVVFFLFLFFLEWREGRTELLCTPGMQCWWEWRI